MIREEATPTFICSDDKPFTNENDAKKHEALLDNADNIARFIATLTEDFKPRTLNGPIKHALKGYVQFMAVDTGEEQKAEPPKAEKAPAEKPATAKPAAKSKAVKDK